MIGNLFETCNVSLRSVARPSVQPGYNSSVQRHDDDLVKTRPSISTVDDMVNMSHWAKIGWTVFQTAQAL